MSLLLTALVDEMPRGRASKGERKTNCGAFPQTLTETEMGVEESLQLLSEFLAELLQFRETHGDMTTTELTDGRSSLPVPGELDGFRRRLAVVLRDLEIQFGLDEGSELGKAESLFLDYFSMGANCFAELKELLVGECC